MRDRKHVWLVDRYERDGRVTPVSNNPHPTYKGALFSCQVLRGMTGLRYRPRKIEFRPPETAP